MVGYLSVFECMMPVYAVIDSRSQRFAVIKLGKRARQVIHITTIDIFCAAARSLVNCGNHDIEYQSANLFCFFALRKQHANIEERAKIKQA